MKTPFISHENVELAVKSITGRIFGGGWFMSVLAVKQTFASLAAMIRISTIGDLIENGYGLNAHCEACNRHAQVNLFRLADKYGREATFVKSESPIRLKCSRCGASPCDYKLAPPTPG
jgi:hypothetical protein